MTRRVTQLLGSLLVGLVLGACQATRRPAAVDRPPARTEGTSSGGLHYVSEGSGPAVVLVHAFQTDAREWDEIAPRLAASRRVIRYDVRGHGRSAGLVAPAAAQDDLRALLDELGVSRASIAGLSMGSEIALDFALAYPDRVDRVVMVSPSVSGIRADVSLDWVKPIVAAVRANDRGRAAVLWWESPFLAGVRARGSAGERYRTVVLENGRIWGENPANRRSLEPPAAGRLEQLRAPLLVGVGGADARGFHLLADTLVRRVPSARSEVIPGAGHMISMERPGDLARLIESFLPPAVSERR